MAKIMIEVDTEAKDLSVSVDGKKYKDVAYIMVNKGFDSYREKSTLSIDICSESDMDNGMKQHTKLYAYADENAQLKSIAKLFSNKEV